MRALVPEKDQGPHRPPPSLAARAALGRQGDDTHAASLPGGAAARNAAAAAEERARQREAEAHRQALAPQMRESFGATTTLTPVMSSPGITEEEQAAIARWVTLLAIARREPPPGVAPNGLAPH